MWRPAKATDDVGRVDKNVFCATFGKVGRGTIGASANDRSCGNDALFRPSEAAGLMV